MRKNHQHEHKGKPYTQEKSQVAATSMEDAITNREQTSGIETCSIPCPGGYRMSPGRMGNHTKY
jgi:hypothetical protein